MSMPAMLGQHWLRLVRSAATVLLGATLAGLVGCATTSSDLPPEPALSNAADPAPADTFLLSGRFSLRQAQQAAHGRFEWQHEREIDKILLSGPLGQGVAEFDCQPELCRMQAANGETRQSPNSAELMKSLLGVAFPLDQIVGWLQGRSEGADRVERDDRHRLVKLWRDGWRVDYEYEGALRKPWLLMVNDGGDIELRLRIESWQDEIAPEAKTKVETEVKPESEAEPMRNDPGETPGEPTGQPTEKDLSPPQNSISNTN